MGQWEKERKGRGFESLYEKVGQEGVEEALTELKDETQKYSKANPSLKELNERLLRVCETLQLQLDAAQRELKAERIKGELVLFKLIELLNLKDLFGIKVPKITKTEVDWLLPNEVSRLTGIDRKQIWRLIKLKKLPTALSPSGRVMVHSSGLANLSPPRQHRRFRSQKTAEEIIASDLEGETDGKD